jgi:hypothetical protein
MFLPVYSLAQTREYSGPVMSKNKIIWCHATMNYVSLSFDICRKNGVWTKTAPIMERSGSSSEIHVHCRTVWCVVNCSILNNLCCRFCKIFCLSELLYQALMYFRVSIYPQKNPGTHHGLTTKDNWFISLWQQHSR